MAFTLDTNRHREATTPINMGGLQLTESVAEEVSGAYSEATLASVASTPSYMPQASTDDVLVPNFTDRRNAGEIIMNDYQSVKTNMVGFNLPWQFSSNKYLDYGYERYNCNVVGSIDPYYSGATVGYLIPYSLITPSIDAEYDLVMSRVYSKTSEAAMLALTTAYEFKKSVATINRCFRESWKMLKYVIKTKRLLAAGLVSAENAAQIYLEVRYGLRPIIYDVRNAVDAISSVGKTKRKRVYSAMPVHHEEVAGEFTTNLGNYVWIKGDRKVIHERYVSGGAIVKPRLSITNINDAFGTTDLVESVWEIIPFSFIADWFVNLGDYLSALAPNFDVDVLGTWFKVTDYKYLKFTPTKMWYEHNGYTRASSQMLQSHPVRWEVTTTTRYVNRGKPSYPRLNIRLDGLKLLDILAILKENVKHLRI